MSVTPAEINRMNRQFWESERLTLEPLLADEALVRSALALVKWEAQRMVPFKYQSSFESAIRAAFTIKDHVVTGLASKAGRARKPDALTGVIMEIVRKRPTITVEQLLDRLKGWGEPIQDIEDGMIHFTTREI